MSAFEFITIAVGAGSIGVGLAVILRAGGPLDSLGRQGSTWFSHESDLPLSDRPSEDDRDAPLPRRPLRGRPD